MQNLHNSKTNECLKYFGNLSLSGNISGELYTTIIIIIINTRYLLITTFRQHFIISSCILHYHKTTGIIKTITSWYYEPNILEERMPAQ